MFKIITAAVKELLLLKRDRAGLMVLFIMPALLVIVITLVQENVMELTGQKKTQVLFLDLDEGDLGSLLREQLAIGHLELVAWDKELKTQADIETAVADGDFQVGVVVPEGSSDKIEQEAVRLFQKNEQHIQKDSVVQVPVHVFFDPGVMPGFRSGLTAQLKMALETLGMEAKLTSLDRELNSLLESLGIPDDFAPLPAGGLSGSLRQPLFILEERGHSSRPKETEPYSPVQQNVPAWALFGMFFTSIPIAGAILQERKSGIWIRLASLPVSQLVLFSGKAVAYIGVCICQFLLIGLVGALLFPYLGLPAFTISESLVPILLTVLCSSLAACGFGILLGMVCNSYQQASTLGSTGVVVAAALGGVMVPVYAMPQIMQRVSIVSPLNWSMTAFHDLLVRGASFSAIWDDLGRLTLFFLVTILLAWKLAQLRI